MLSPNRGLPLMSNLMLLSGRLFDGIFGKSLEALRSARKPMLRKFSVVLACEIAMQETHLYQQKQT